MKFEDLDADTRNIIDGMCHHTDKTREQAILALVEFGMVAMQAAIAETSFFNNRQKKIMEVVYNVVNADEKLQKTAEAYRAVWSLSV